MEYDEPHLTSNEKTQPVQWTKRLIGALVVVGSFWPIESSLKSKNQIELVGWTIKLNNASNYLSVNGWKYDKIEVEFVE